MLRVVRPSIVAILVVAVLGGLATACRSQGPEPRPGSRSEDPLEGGEHVIDAADGVPMRYSVRGPGNEPTILLVHGWMCDFTFWDFNKPVLARRYRTIAVDLPGHGGSGKTRERWTVEDYAADVAHLIETLDLRDFVVVGHSMGGPVALLAAARVPGRVLGVIGVDTFQNAEMEFPPEQLEAMIAGYESDWDGTCANFVNSMFLEGADPRVRDTVRAEMCGGDPAVGIALMKDFPNWDYRRAFEGVGDLPVRAINASYMTTEVEVNRRYAADFDVRLMDDVGHFLHMVRPEEFNALLVETIGEIVGPGNTTD